MGWFGDLPRTWAPACLAVAIAAATSACGPDGPRVPDIVDHINSIDLTPRFPSSPESSGRPAQSPRPVSYVGTDAAPIRRVAATPSSGEGYELNFDNTPVATVAKVILGDILGVGYVIDPRVQGTVTLASGRPVPKSDILFVL